MITKISIALIIIYIVYVIGQYRKYNNRHDVPFLVFFFMEAKPIIMFIRIIAFILLFWIAVLIFGWYMYDMMSSI